MRFPPSWTSWRARAVGAVTAIGVVVSLGAAGLSAANPAIASVDDFGPGDGLHRYLVTLTGDPGTPAAAPAPAPDAEVTSSAAGGALDLALLAQAQVALGTGGHLEAQEGRLHYVTEAGTRVVSPGHADAPSAVAPSPADAPLPAGSDALLAALAAQPGVVSAQRVVDEQVLVATSLTMDEVAAFPQVAHVEESVSVPVAATATDPYVAPYGWNLKNTGSNAFGQDAKAGADIDAPAAWDVTQGQDTVVAVVDTGFDTDHPDLQGALWTNPTEACGTVDTNGNGRPGDCHGWNFYANNADLDNGTMGSHGTGVSGIVAARIDNGVGSAGVAPGTKVMPLVIGGGDTVDISLAITAFRYAADNGADVINASFGGYFTGTTLTQMSEAIDYATSKGVVVVAAAGNDARSRDTDPVYPASMTNAGLVTVGSTNALDNPAVSSAYGRTSVDLFAPGDKVLTTYNDGGYRLISGTSIAAPHVAGAVALFRSVNPDATVAEVKAALMTDAVELAALADKCVSGGRLTVGSIRGAGAGANESVAYAFSSMVAPPSAQQPTVTLTSTASTGTYDVVLGLAMRVDGEVWAVSGEDITLGGTTLTTDDTGTATFSLGSLPYLGTRDLTPALTLGEGMFALTAQVLKDGQPLSRPYAAPLVVDADATPAPGPGTDPTSPAGPTDPAAPGPNTPTGPVDPGTDEPAPTDPGGSDPDPGPGTTPVPGPVDPGTPLPVPTGPGGGSPDPTDPGATPGPGGPGPTDPGTAPVPAPVGPGTDEPAPVPTIAPGPGADFATFDRVGAFRVTRMSPVHVTGGVASVVIINGEALEAGVGVRVGTSTTTHVLTATTTLVSFLSPTTLVPGTYDVTVFKNGRTSVLPDALVVGASGSPAPGGGTDPGANDPGDPAPTNPGTSPGPGGTTPPPATSPTPGGTAPAPGSTPAPGATPGPGGSTPPPGTDDPDTPATTPTTPQATRVGPNGERLVRNDALASLAGLWAISCSAGCAGQQV